MTYRATNHGSDAIYTALAQLDWDSGDSEVIIRKHKPLTRTKAQNKLSYLWYAAIGVQTSNDSEYERARNKLEHGIPILRRDDDEAREVYDESLKGLSYEKKIKLIRKFQIPVTSLFNVKQFTEYLDIVDRECSTNNIQLPYPSDVYERAMGK